MPSRVRRSCVRWQFECMTKPSTGQIYVRFLPFSSSMTPDLNHFQRPVGSPTIPISNSTESGKSLCPLSYHLVLMFSNKYSRFGLHVLSFAITSREFVWMWFHANTNYFLYPSYLNSNNDKKSVQPSGTSPLKALIAKYVSNIILLFRM